MKPFGEPVLNKPVRTRIRRGRGVNILLVVVSLIASALLVEIGLRVYAELLFPKMMVLDDTLGWRHARNVSRTFRNEVGENVLVVLDGHGLRGGPHLLEKHEGKSRILVLGDSFTDGVQVGEQDLFTAKMETADSHLELINAGVGGYGTVQQYLYLISEGIRFHPDLVLLMFFENDLSDNLLTYYPGFGPRPYATLQGGSVNVVERMVTSDYERFILSMPFRLALNKYSYFYYFLNTRVYQPMFASQMRRMQQADLSRLDADTRYHTFFGVLSRLHSFLKQKGIPLVVVLIPSSNEVAAGRSDVATTISEHCLAHEIHCLPLIDRFRREASAGAELYFRQDIHWTKTGHQVAADEILNYLPDLMSSSYHGNHHRDTKTQ
jgi:lysophospholipase L1-like esterase